MYSFDAELSRRSVALHRRAQWIGLLAFVLCAMAAVLLVRASADLWQVVNHLFDTGRAPLHIPDTFRALDQFGRPAGFFALHTNKLVFFGLIGATIYGYRSGKLYGPGLIIGIALVVLAGVFSISTAAPHRNAVFGFPSEVERTVMAGDPAQARKLLTTYFSKSPNTIDSQYIEAQLAMRLGDKAGVLNNLKSWHYVVDSYYYGRPGQYGTSGGRAPGYVGELRTAVLYDLEKIAFGRASSGPALAMHARIGNSAASWLRVSAMLLLALITSLAAAACIAIWRKMRANLGIISDPANAMPFAPLQPTAPLAS